MEQRRQRSESSEGRRPRASTRTGGDVPERPCRQLAATPGRLCSKLAATPERPCCQLTATLGLSLYDPAFKEEPVRATRAGPQLVFHFAMLLFTLSLQGMRMLSETHGLRRLNDLVTRNNIGYNVHSLRYNIHNSGFNLGE